MFLEFRHDKSSTRLTGQSYPSLLESSDADGGSSVAVLTYLRHILDALDHPELVHMILQYLLALLDYTSEAPRNPRSPAALKRKQSLMLLNSGKEEDDRLNPSLFNLVDLILGSTSSKSPQTITAALKLSSIILSKNHGYALGSLIKVMNIHHKEHYRTIGSLNKELDLYLSLAVDIAGQEGVDSSYENYLKDTLTALETHPCSLKSIILAVVPTKGPGYFDAPETMAKEVDPHYLLPEDPLFQSLLDLLLRFLTNDVETNLALTETIMSIGMCSQLRLEGWLSVDPADYQFESSEVDLSAFANDNLRDMYMAERQPIWDVSSAPQLLACLQQLQSQINALRNDITDWDEHVANRKTAFRFQDEMLEASKVQTPQAKATRQSSDTPTPAGTWTPQIPKRMLDNSTTPSRTQSPRGRKEALSEQRRTPTASPAPSRLGGQTLVGSPSRGMSPLPAPVASKRQTTLFADVDANLANVKNSQFLKRRIRFRRKAGEREVEVLLSKYQPPPPDEEESKKDGEEGNVKEAVLEGEEDDVREASLMHIITNVVMLQDFVLELVALIQVRASLFGEVRFA